MWRVKKRGRIQLGQRQLGLNMHPPLKDTIMLPPQSHFFNYSEANITNN